MRLTLITCIAVCALALPARAQLFGTGSGTFVDYLYSAADQSVNFRVPGQVGAGYNPLYTGSPNVVMTQPYGLWSSAANYLDGQYQIKFTAPNAAAVAVSVGGMFSNLQRQAPGSYVFSLHHDNGNPLAGGGEIDLTGGVSAANPVSNFTVTPLGGNPRDLTPLFISYAGKYQGVRWMNNNNVNQNSNTLTAADLVPPGQNIGDKGNSYADIGRWTGQIPNDQLAWINSPVGADVSFWKGMADQMADNLPVGKRVRLEYGNENWNFGGFSHPGKILQLAQSDPRIAPSSDNYTTVARETGLRTMDMYHAFMSEWVAKGRDANDVDAFVNSQGAGQYFADQAIAAVKANNGGTLNGSGIKSRGISFYPADNLSGAGSVDQLVSALYADLPRQEQYLRNEVAAAKVDGLAPGIYEWSPEGGYLTLGGVPINVITAFRADPRSKQWVLDEWNAIKAILGPVPNSFAMEFTVEGDLWTPQLDPLAPHEPAQLAIDQISAGIIVPEPACAIPVLAIGAWLVLGRRRAA